MGDTPASLLRDGTVDTNSAYQYLTITGDSKIWDVTDVDNAEDEVVAGSFDYANAKHAVIVRTNNNQSIKTAWVWDMDGDPIYGTSCTFNWNLDNYQTVWAPNGTTVIDWMAYSQILDAFDAGKNVLIMGNAILNYPINIPADRTLQVEGNLTTSATGNVTGNGSLRVRGTFNANADIRVNTQAVNLYAANDITIAADTHVQNYAQLGTDNLDSTALTIATGVHLCARDYDNTGIALEANDYVWNNGHIETTGDAHFHAGGHDVSTNSMVINGDLYLCDTFTVGNGTSAGSLTIVGGTIYSGATVTCNDGDLVVNNGTVTLTSGSAINMDGDLTVNANGRISQSYSYNARDVIANTVTVNGGEVAIYGDLVGLTGVDINGAADVRADEINAVNPNPITIESGASVSGNIANNTTPVIDSNGNRTYTGNYEGGTVTNVTLTVNATNANVQYNGAAVTAPISVAPNATVELVVTPAEGFESVTVTANGATVAPGTAANTYVVTMGTANATLTVTGVAAGQMVTVATAGNAVAGTDYTITPASFDRAQETTITVTPVEGGDEITAVTCDVTGVTFTEDTATGVWTATVAANAVAEGTNSITVTVTKQTTIPTGLEKEPYSIGGTNKSYTIYYAALTNGQPTDTRTLDNAKLLAAIQTKNEEIGTDVATVMVNLAGTGLDLFDANNDPIEGVNVALKGVYSISLETANNLIGWTDGTADTINVADSYTNTNLVAVGTAGTTLYSVNRVGVLNIPGSVDENLVLTEAVKITYNTVTPIMTQDADGEFTVNVSSDDYVAAGSTLRITSAAAIANNDEYRQLTIDGKAYGDKYLVDLQGTEKLVYPDLTLTAELVGTDKAIAIDEVTPDNEYAVTLDGTPVTVSNDSFTANVNTLAGAYMVVSDTKAYETDSDNLFEVELTAQKPGEYTYSITSTSGTLSTTETNELVPAVKVELSPDSSLSDAFVDVVINGTDMVESGDLASALYFANDAVLTVYTEANPGLTGSYIAYKIGSGDWTTVGSACTAEENEAEIDLSRLNADHDSNGVTIGIVNDFATAKTYVETKVVALQSTADYTLTWTARGVTTPVKVGAAATEDVPVGATVEVADDVAFYIQTEDGGNEYVKGGETFVVTADTALQSEKYYNVSLVIGAGVADVAVTPENKSKFVADTGLNAIVFTVGNDNGNTNATISVTGATEDSGTPVTLSGTNLTVNVNTPVSADIVVTLESATK